MSDSTSGVAGGEHAKVGPCGQGRVGMGCVWSGGLGIGRWDRLMRVGSGVKSEIHRERAGEGWSEMTPDSAKGPCEVAREWLGSRRGRDFAALFSDEIRHFSKPDLRFSRSFPLFAAL